MPKTSDGARRPFKGNREEKSIIRCLIRDETDDAYLVLTERSDPAWVLKSQVRIEKFHDGPEILVDLELPEWVASDKGLI